MNFFVPKCDLKNANRQNDGKENGTAPPTPTRIPRGTLSARRPLAHRLENTVAPKTDRAQTDLSMVLTQDDIVSFTVRSMRCPCMYRFSQF